MARQAGTAARLALVLCAALSSSAPANAADDAQASGAAPCVRDADSGLLWAARRHDGGLNDRRWTYTPYDGNPATNGGYAGYRDATSGDCPRDLMQGRSCNTEAYIAAVNASALCGYRDWRLPTYTELAAIAGRTSSTATPSAELPFADIEEGWYWTAVAKVGITSFSRVVLLPPRARPRFYDGSYLVMAVRGPTASEPAPSPGAGSSSSR